VVNAHSRFLWYELMTTDTEAAKAFYAKVVGWGTRDASIPGRTYTLFTAGEAAVSGVIDLPADARKIGAEPSWMGYVGVDDVDATIDRIKRLGGTVHLPPTDIPNVGRLAVVADPQMATLALVKWLNPGHEQSEKPAEVKTTGCVGWHELLAADWQKAFAFYREVFDWKNAGSDTTGTYQLISAGGQTIGGTFNKPAMVPVPFWLYYFNVPDIDAAAERVKAGGGQILEGPLEVPGGTRVARCTDPQGAMFALTGKRSDKAIGYFERVASHDSPNTPFGLGRRPLD
jgi:uncharacterized protein